MMSEARPLFIKVIKNDFCLALIAVPPLVLHLNEGRRILLASPSTFASTRCPPIPYAPNIIMVSCLIKEIKHTSSFDESRKLKEIDSPLKNRLFRGHVQKVLVVLCLLLLGRNNVNRGDKVSSFLTICLNSTPRLRNLIVAVMRAKIPSIHFEILLALILKESMKMPRPILVKLLSNNPFREGTSLFKKFECILLTN